MKNMIVGFWKNIGVLLLICILSGCFYSRCTVGAASGEATAATICAVLAAPKLYTGKPVEVVARITRTKEGIGLWNPSCGNLGIDLLIDFNETDKPGFKELEEALKVHGLSDHPVIATVQGVFTFNHYDKFRKQKRPILIADRILDIHQSSNVEHPWDSYDSDAPVHESGHVDPPKQQ
jgi:hypothetical protein